mmetsp:Transcript_26728/g.74877  ORF Transcript_26728/g.74877 Transcript_26728/m.74877 type:complete len:445 (+) Transcript_26728:91-1425(+)
MNLLTRVRAKPSSSFLSLLLLRSSSSSSFSSFSSSSLPAPLSSAAFLLPRSVTSASAAQRPIATRAMSSSSTTPNKDANHDDDGWKSQAEDYQKHAQRFTGMFAESAARQVVKARLEEASTTSSSGAAPSFFPTRSIRCLDIAAGTGVAAFATIDAIRDNDGDGHRPHTATTKLPIVMTATDLSPAMLESLDGQVDDRVHSKYNSDISDSNKGNAVSGNDVVGNQNTTSDMIHHDNATSSVTVNTIVQDMTDLKDIPDASIDICTLVFGITFPDDPVAAFREIRRVLDPNGGVATVVSWTWNSIIQDFHEAALDQGKITDTTMDEFPLPYGAMGNEHHLRMAAMQAGFGSSSSSFSSPSSSSSSPPTPSTVSVSYIQHEGVPIPVFVLVNAANNNPGLAAMRPFDEGKLESFLLQRSAGSNEHGPYVLCGGTAMCLNIRMGGSE